jgi:hypothetical protein
MNSSRTFVTVSPVALGTLGMLFLDPGLSELKNFAPTIILAFVILFGVIRLAPTWKEVKMREMDIREKEIAQRSEQSMAVQTLAECTRDIAIEMKHTAEALRIAERVTIMRSEELKDVAQELQGQLDTLSARAATATT